MPWIKTERGNYYDPSNEELIVATAINAGGRVDLDRYDVMHDIETASEIPNQWRERYTQLILDEEPGWREKEQCDYVSAVLDAAANGRITWWHFLKPGQNEEQAYKEYCAGADF